MIMEWYYHDTILNSDFWWRQIYQIRSDWKIVSKCLRFWIGSNSPLPLPDSSRTKSTPPTSISSSTTSFGALAGVFGFLAFLLITGILNFSIQCLKNCKTIRNLFQRNPIPMDSSLKVGFWVPIRHILFIFRHVLSTNMFKTYLGVELWRFLDQKRWDVFDFLGFLKKSTRQQKFSIKIMA